MTQFVLARARILSQPIVWMGTSLSVAILVGTLVVFGQSHQSKQRTYTAFFTAPSTSLDGSAFAAGLTWSVVGGSFTTQSGTAAGHAAGQSPTFATVDVGPNAAVITVTYVRVADGSGFVFRYVDENNYWSIVAASQFGTWNIYKTVNDQTLFVANTGNNLQGANTSVQVQQHSSEMTVLIDGVPSMRVDDRALLDGPRIGMLSAAIDQGQTRWQSVSVSVT